MKNITILFLLLIFTFSCLAKTDVNGQELPKWYKDDIIPYKTGTATDDNKIPLPAWLEEWKIENQDPPPKKYYFSNHNIFDFPPMKKENKLKAVIPPTIKFETIKDDVGNDIPAWKKDMDEELKNYTLLNEAMEPTLPDWAKNKDDTGKKDSNGTALPKWY